MKDQRKKRVQKYGYNEKGYKKKLALTNEKQRCSLLNYRPINQKRSYENMSCE